jgi:hypothetical protein
MKRYLISTIAAIFVLSMALSVFGQEQVAQKGDIIKERSQSMTTSQLTSQVKQKTSTVGREEQLKAIETVQEQLRKLRAAILSFDDEAMNKFGELSEEEKNKLKENMAKSIQARNASILKIDEQLAVLRGSAPRKTEPLMPIRELKVIREIAIKENATDTAYRIEKIINRYHSDLKLTYETALKEKAKQTTGRLKKLTDRYQKELASSRTKEPVKTSEQPIRGPMILETGKSPTKK